jgi:hypothetical protein
MTQEIRIKTIACPFSYSTGYKNKKNSEWDMMKVPVLN